MSRRRCAPGRRRRGLRPRLGSRQRASRPPRAKPRSSGTWAARQRHVRRERRARRGRRARAWALATSAAAAAAASRSSRPACAAWVPSGATSPCPASEWARARCAAPRQARRRRLRRGGPGPRRPGRSPRSPRRQAGPAMRGQGAPPARPVRALPPCGLARPSRKSRRCRHRPPCSGPWPRLGCRGLRRPPRRLAWPRRLPASTTPWRSGGDLPPRQGHRRRRYRRAELSRGPSRLAALRWPGVRRPRFAAGDDARAGRRPRPRTARTTRRRLRLSGPGPRGRGRGRPSRRWSRPRRSGLGAPEGPPVANLLPRPCRRRRDHRHRPPRRAVLASARRCCSVTTRCWLCCGGGPRRCRSCAPGRRFAPSSPARRDGPCSRG